MASRIFCGAMLLCLTPYYLAVASNNSLGLEEIWNAATLAIDECSGEDEKGGLDCSKEGYFIHRFRSHALWKRSTEPTKRIPASRSLCCRPELPTAAALGMSLPTGVQPIAVVSVGCHLSTNEEKANMACEAESKGFVTGFVDSFVPSTAVDIRVPSKGVVCCSPVLLLSSGNVWGLEPCQCADYDSIDCSDDRLLWGFSKAATTEKHSVPVPPARCCRVCLGQQQYDMEDCNHLKNCNGHGVCVMGRCACYPDWIGADCHQSKEGYFNKKTLQSSIWWLAGLGFMGAFFCFFATFWIIRRSESDDSNARNNHPRRQAVYLQRSNDTGSIGSSDGDTPSPSEEETDETTGDGDVYRPLLQLPCLLCHDATVQVTLVPCGHSNLCRKCSRKITECPFCRRPIERRQRLYLSV